MPATTRQWPCRGVYLVTPDDIDEQAVLARSAAALGAGAVMLQYRSKRADAARRHSSAHALRALTRAHGSLLIVNDDVELARQVGADGVHLGRDDAPIASARRRLGAAAIIGASCYDDPARAHAAAAAGADYLAFGAFFASPTKPLARRARPDLLTAAAGYGLPLVAIGGISADNGRPLVAAGARLLAVVSAVYAAPDPAAATRRLTSLFEHEPNP
ncbi:MAG TPA: thiamine phosphate synthase [Xanthomonadaceae bacterium]|nr:thiamine phosphate synthase [Xanthomonadaceae bacterium]